MPGIFFHEATNRNKVRRHGARTGWLESVYIHTSRDDVHFFCGSTEVNQSFALTFGNCNERMSALEYGLISNPVLGNCFMN